MRLSDTLEFDSFTAYDSMGRSSHSPVVKNSVRYLNESHYETIFFCPAGEYDTHVRLAKTIFFYLRGLLVAQVDFHSHQYDMGTLIVTLGAGLVGRDSLAQALKSLEEGMKI